MATTGELIRRHRMERGLSQRQLADLMGVGQSAISMWETNRWLPTIKNIRRAAEVCEVPVAWLLGDDEPDKPSRAG